MSTGTVRGSTLALGETGEPITVGRDALLLNAEVRGNAFNSEL